MVNTSADKIYIQSDDDWSRMRDRGLSTVVDPMVFRTGDVFLRGRKRITATDPGKDTEALWRALEANIGSLATFFDLLVLQPQLPIFDYESTFPVWNMENWQARTELIDMCNQGDEPVLVPVSVAHDIYLTVKQAAVRDLAIAAPAIGDVDTPPELQAASRLPDPASDLGRAIVEELSAFDYEWRPELPGVEQEPPDSARRALTTFMFGGSLFGGYAQLLGGDHVLQPGRSKLFLAMALRQSQLLNEDRIFERAFPIARESPFDLERVTELPRAPSVLPYLLTFGDETPAQLLKRALNLRKHDAVMQLRDRLGQIREERSKGFISPETERELGELETAARKSLRPRGDLEFDLELKLDAAVIPAVGVGMKVSPARLWAWALSQLPSRRYRKLLVRMLIAQRSYVDISRHLSMLWNE